MTEIDVPDWVVEAGAKAILAIANPKCVGELAAYQFAEDAITAALGAWVVPVGVAEVKKLSERTSSYDIAPRDWSFYLSDGKHTLYTLRQEKPE